MKGLQVFLVLMFCTVCRAQHVARIESRAFYKPERGVKQLIRSLESYNRAFFALEPKARDAEFDRIASACINEPRHKEDAPCRVLDDISVALEQFARHRQIVLLLDVDYGNVTTLYGKLDVADAEDITRLFMEEYNRLHP